MNCKYFTTSLQGAAKNYQVRRGSAFCAHNNNLLCSPKHYYAMQFLRRRMGIANGTCISFCNKPKVNFGLPWVRPLDNRGKCHMDEIEKMIQCLSNTSQHVLVLQLQLKVAVYCRVVEWRYSVDRRWTTTMSEDLPSTRWSIRHQRLEGCDWSMLHWGWQRWGQVTGYAACWHW